MLRPLVYSLLLLSLSTLRTDASHAGACPASLPGKSFSESSFMEGSLGEKSKKIIEIVQVDKDFQALLAESAQKQTAVLESKEFQEIVKTLQTQASPENSQLKHKLGHTNPAGELFLFVSFSLGEKALLNLAHEAKNYGATLVLRGFKDNSYAQTVKALQKIIQETGQGFIIDPELFSLFAVTVVPTTILSRPFHIHAVERTQTPLHDRIQGHISLHYALEQFAKEGDLQNEARSLLEKAGKGGLQ